MTRQEFYRILVDDKILHDRLSTEEFFDKIEDLSVEFYETGQSSNIRTEIIIEE